MNLNQKFFSKIGFNYLIYAACAIIFSIIIINIVGNAELTNDYNFRLILSAICNYILPFPILLFLMKKLDREKLEKESLSIKTFLLYFCISYLLMIIGNVIGLMLTAAIGNAIQSDVANPIQTLINSTDILLNLIIISTIAPIFEEIIFRKLLIDRTIKYGYKISIILSATLFALMHGNLNQFFYTFLLGGFFAYVYIKTGKIIYTIILHLILNLIGSVFSLFIVESVTAVTQGTYVAFDIGIILIYAIFIIMAMTFGLYGLIKYRKADLTKIKAKIELANPLRTAFINPGMLCYIGFTLLLITYTTFLM